MSNNSITTSLRACLFDDASLIKHLERYAPEKISLTVQAQTWEKPHIDEANILHLRNGVYGLLRETLLTCTHKPWIYARTIIPPQTLLISPRLAHWGNKPLGHYLFADRQAHRGKIAITTLTMSNYVPRGDRAILDNTTLWGRRSIFYVKNKPLLLTEIFLPEAIACINSPKK